MKETNNKTATKPRKPELKTLWRAKLMLAGTGKDEFLFRCTSDFSEASDTAEKLLAASPGAQMTGAEIVAVEMVAHLRN